MESESEYVPLSENEREDVSQSQTQSTNIELLERKLSAAGENLSNEALGLDKYGSLNTLKLLPDFVEYYNATRSLRYVMRILSLWHPNYATAFTRAAYPYVLWGIILFPWAHFFIREGAVDDSYHNTVAFGVGKLLTIACFYLARRYFARSHFVQIIVSVFDPKTDVYQYFDGEGNRVAQKTRKCDRRRMFNRIVNKSLVLFYMQVFIATICYLVFIILTSGEERDPWIITLDIINIFCTAVGTAVFAFLAAFSKLIFRFHVMDIRRHLSLYTIHERRAGSIVGPPSLAPHSFLGTSDTKHLHPHQVHLDGRHANLNDVLAYHGWQIEDIRFLDSKLSVLLRDYMRISRDVRGTSRTFRLFLVMVFLLSIIGGLLSMFILLEDLRRSQYSYFSVHFPNILNLYFSLSVLSTAAKIAHKARYITVKVSEFNAYAAIHSDTESKDKCRTQSAPTRSAALVQLVSNKPIYVSLYGISLDRSMAFAFLSPLVALTLFIVQKALTGS